MHSCPVAALSSSGFAVLIARSLLPSCKLISMNLIGQSKSLYSYYQIYRDLISEPIRENVNRNKGSGGAFFFMCTYHGQYLTQLHCLLCYFHDSPSISCYGGLFNLPFVISKRPLSLFVCFTTSLTTASYT